MKNLILVLAMLMSAQAFAESSVTCEMGSRYLDVSETDEGSLAVSHDQSDYLHRVEVQYEGSQEYTDLEKGDIDLENKSIRNVRITFDQGTSIKLVYVLPWSKFADGEEMRVQELFVTATGKVDRKKIIKCMGAQS